MIISIVTKPKLLVIQSKLDCKVVDNCSIESKGQMRTFTSLQPAIALERETVHINQVILFNRLTIIKKNNKKELTSFNMY